MCSPSVPGNGFLGMLDARPHAHFQVLTYQYEITTSKLKIICSLFEELDLRLSKRYNAVCGYRDPARADKGRVRQLVHRGGGGVPVPDGAPHGIRNRIRRGYAQDPARSDRRFCPVRPWTRETGGCRGVGGQGAAVYGAACTKMRDAAGCRHVRDRRYGYQVLRQGPGRLYAEDPTRATEPPRPSRTSRFTESAVPQTSYWRPNRSPGTANWPIS